MSSCQDSQRLKRTGLLYSAASLGLFGMCFSSHFRKYNQQYELHQVSLELRRFMLLSASGKAFQLSLASDSSTLLACVDNLSL